MNHFCIDQASWTWWFRVPWCQFSTSPPATDCDVIKWKHFPRYCAFVRGFHRSLVDSPHKGRVTRTFYVPLLSVGTNCWTNTRPVTRDAMMVIWRHRNVCGGLTVTIMRKEPIWSGNCLFLCKRRVRIIRAIMRNGLYAVYIFAIGIAWAPNVVGLVRSYGFAH